MAAFDPSQTFAHHPWWAVAQTSSVSPMFRKLFNARGAPRGPQTYLGGAYRRHREQDEERFTALARAAFPRYAARISCFGADWLGRQFATDSARIVGTEPQVLMLEPGTGEALEIATSFATFHSDELTNHAESAVAWSFFKEWCGSGGKPPDYEQCIGYKVPLYLGGSDDLGNLALSDFDVYWTLAAQLLAKARRQPVGTPIGRVSIRDGTKD